MLSITVSNSLNYQLFPIFAPQFLTMAEIKPVTPAKKTKAPKPSFDTTPLFGKENYRWMLIGLVLVALGLLLMGGGYSKDPNVFNPNEVYSFVRITVAPNLDASRVW